MDNLFVVDEIFENIVKLENLHTKEIKEESIYNLPVIIHEGSILKLKNNNYIIDDDTELARRKTLRDRLEKLKRKENCNEEN